MSRVPSAPSAPSAFQLLANHKFGGKQVHDANIVATMKAYGITTLLTHNVKDFKRFAEIIKIEEI